MPSMLSSRLNTAILVFIAMTGVVIVAMLATGARGGPLDPPGPVASTQSNVIYQPASGCAAFPIVIATPGSYRLGGNITGCNGLNGIKIDSGNVSLDLAGFSLIGVPGSLDGIRNTGSNHQLNIANGTITGWGGTGLNLKDAHRSRVDNIIASGNKDGITLDTATALSNSTASGNNAYGITTVATSTHVTIAGCNVNLNGSTGIRALGTFIVLEDCAVSGNGGGGIQTGAGARIDDVLVASNASSGIALAGSDNAVDHAVVVDNGSSGIIMSAGVSRTLISNCLVARNSTVTDGTSGIEGGEHVTVDRCSITYTAGADGQGINVGPYARLTNNDVGHNGDTGVTAGHSCFLADNTSSWNVGHGFVVLAPGNCTILRNKATANVSSNGFFVLPNGGNTLVDGNHASDNAQGFSIQAAIPGDPNIVIRNTASGNIANQYFIGANNDVAPIVTAGAAVNPMSNISN